MGNAIVETPQGSPNNVQLNMTIANKASTKSYTATASSQSFARGTGTQSIEVVNLVTNSGVVYLKYGYGSAGTVSATDFDAVVNPGERIQVGYTEDITHVSYIGSGSDVIKVIER